ncbi:MAG TPA: sulfite exporter TauE/SafE family protein, partial [Leptolyngbya sp.]|nr:sulfite exporter TauE/SafE family protein [Leptolyngbya sp.]
MLDLFLIASVGFLGSFGHCLGMCSPLTVAFSLSHQGSRSQQIWFNLLLNAGRVISYVMVGAAIGA